MNEIPPTPVAPVQAPPVIAQEAVLLSEILVNQHEILRNQKVLMDSDKNRRMWGIIKMVIIAVLVIAPLFFIPAMIDSMMGELMPGAAGNNASALEGINFKALMGDPDALLKEMMGQ